MLWSRKLLYLNSQVHYLNPVNHMVIIAILSRPLFRKGKLDKHVISWCKKFKTKMPEMLWWCSKYNRMQGFKLWSRFIMIVLRNRSKESQLESRLDNLSNKITHFSNKLCQLRPSQHLRKFNMICRVFQLLTNENLINYFDNLFITLHKLFIINELRELW